LNDDFSIEYANERYNGEESEMNRRYEWEDELEIKGNATGIEPHENANVPLEGTMPNGDSFSEKLTKMRVFNVFSGEELIASLSCSEILLDSFTVDESGDELVLKVYLKDKEPMSNPVPGMYVSAHEFPNSLIF
jgi:hypothetical protein